MVFTPLPGDAPSQVRPSVPDLLGHGSKIHADDPGARLRGKQDDVPVVVVLNLDQMINVRGWANHNPIRNRHAKLEGQEERVPAAAGEDCRTLRARVDL